MQGLTCGHILMARISINKASQDFHISRNTLYKHIKQGKISKDADGKLDTADLVRLYGTHVSTQQESTTVNSSKSDEIVQLEQLKSENEQLKQHIAVSEMRINELKQQLEYVKQNEAWLKEQLDQKRIEHNDSKKKGLFNKLFG
jgi:hypothetical protein